MIQKAIIKIPPLRIATLILALILYAGIFKPANPFVFRSCVPIGQLSSLRGTVLSDPAKTSSGRFYSFLLNTEEVWSVFVHSSARGCIRILVSSESVESAYSGKFFPSAKKGVPIEQGACLVCTGYCIKKRLDAEQTVFIAEKTLFCGWKNELSRIRALSRLSLKRVLYAWGDAGGLLLALVSGSREYTDETLALAFQKAGLAHLLALSGMHLSLFVSAAGFAGLFTGKKISSVLSLILMCIFIWFAGASPSLLRAFLCAVIMFITRLCFVELTELGSFDCLCAAFIVQATFLHTDIHAPAFMFSYAAVAGILLLGPHLRPLLNTFLPLKLAEATAASFAAWICTVPLSALFFGQITPIGLIASIMVVPLASLFFVTGCLILVFCLALPFLLYPLNAIIQLLYTPLKCTVLWFSRFRSIDLF